MRCASLLWLACACGGEAADPGDDAADNARQTIPEGSDQARGILTVANEATRWDLEDADRAGLLPKTADNILAARAGADGVLGTADDVRFATLAALDAVPWVGAGSLSRLSTFAQAQGLTAPSACAVDSPRKNPADLLVMPDDGPGRILVLIQEARHSIDVVVYQLSNDAIIQALADTARAGVTVRAILDATQSANQTSKATLEAAGAAVHLSSSTFAYTHQKTLVADHRVALVFTGNFDGFSSTTARNYGAVETDWQDIQDLTALFDADWNGRALDVSCTRLVVAPDNAADRVLALIAGATRSLDVEALYVTDSRVVDALVAAHKRGVAVRVVLNDPSYGFSDSTVGKKLRAAGIDARHSNRFFIHAKLIVVDGARVYLGSENFSYNSLQRNREVGLVALAASIDLARVEATFGRDFGAAVKF